MDQDLVVEISFSVRDAAGKPKANISVQYFEHNWTEVLALEKLVIPPLVSTLLAAGDAYNAAASSAATAV